MMFTKERLEVNLFTGRGLVGLISGPIVRGGVDRRLIRRFKATAPFPGSVA